MTLHSKIVLAVALTFFVGVGIQWLSIRSFLLQSFVDLERQSVRTNVARVLDALDEVLVSLDAKGGDWAHWDDTRDFILGKNHTFIKDYLEDVTFATLQIDFMIFVDSAERIVHAKYVDPDTGVASSLPEHLLEHVRTHQYLLSHTGPGDSKSGIILIPEGPFLISAWPVTNNEAKGPIHGTLIVGSLLNEATIRRLSERTHLFIGFTRFSRGPFPVQTKTGQPLFLANQAIAVEEVDENLISGYGRMTDTYGDPALLLKVDMPRAIFMHGKRSTDYFMLMLIAIGILILIVLIVTLKKAVLAPLEKLTAHTKSVCKGENLSPRLNMPGRDEVATLGREFDGMLDRLEEDSKMRRRAEQQLHESEERFRTLSLASFEAIVITKNGRIVDGNDTCEELFGYELSEVLGENLLHFVAPRDRERVRARIVAGDEEAYETKALQKDGSIIDVKVRGRGVTFRGQDCRIAVLRDITDRKQAEVEAHLRRQQLIQADKLTSLGTLVAGIGHEINNPNNFIMMNAPLLGNIWEGILPVLDEHRKTHGNFRVGCITYDKARRRVPQLLGAIEDGSHRIKGIVSNLRDFSRQDSSRMDEDIDLNSVLSAAVALTGNRLKKATRRLSINLSPTRPLVRGNFQRLEQVLINLITNACDALTDSNQAIVVTAFADKARNCVGLRVEDEGCGIHERELKRILDPFFTTKRDSGGTGLGLSISDGIISEHGGTLSFESAYGEGTQATVKLPPVEDGPDTAIEHRDERYVESPS